jgi:hypothetical protein
VPLSDRDDLRIEQLTAELWTAFSDLLDQGGPASRCWCMAPQIGSAYRKRTPQRNRHDLHKLVKNGPPPGLLAFRDELAIGWCRITPRHAVPAIDQS